MWMISKKRCVQLQNKGGYYNTNTNFVRHLTLPMRYDCESLDYSLDISSFLQDSCDRIHYIKAEAKEMELAWLSYADGHIIFCLKGGDQAEQTGHLYCYFKTFGGRSFQINLTQPIHFGQFSHSDPPIDVIPNLVQFPNTQPLSSSDEAFFFFG